MAAAAAQAAAEYAAEAAKLQAPTAAAAQEAAAEAKKAKKKRNKHKKGALHAENCEAASEQKVGSPCGCLMYGVSTSSISHAALMIKVSTAFLQDADTSLQLAAACKRKHQALQGECTGASRRS